MKNFLIITQVFRPDPAAVGQYFDEAAQAIAGTGARVTLLTANRGYDNPKERSLRRNKIATGSKSGVYHFPHLVSQAYRFVFLRSFLF